MPRTEHHHPSARYSKRDGYDKVNTGVAVLAFLSVVAASVVGVYTLKELRRQNKTLEDQTRSFVAQTKILDSQTVFPEVRGRTEICAYYEGAQFSCCGLRGMSVQ